MTQVSPVSTHNEWDPLEEVIVGVIDGAAVPPWHVSLEATMPPEAFDFYRRNGGGAFPADQVDAAREELEGFVAILEGEGVTVRRPEAVDQAALERREEEVDRLRCSRFRRGQAT